MSPCKIRCSTRHPALERLAQHHSRMRAAGGNRRKAPHARYRARNHRLSARSDARLSFHPHAPTIPAHVHGGITATHPPTRIPLPTHPRSGRPAGCVTGLAPLVPTRNQFVPRMLVSAAAPVWSGCARTRGALCPAISGQMSHTRLGAQAGEVGAADLHRGSPRRPRVSLRHLFLFVSNTLFDTRLAHSSAAGSCCSRRAGQPHKSWVCCLGISPRGPLVHRLKHCARASPRQYAGAVTASAAGRASWCRVLTCRHADVVRLVA